MRFEPGPTRPYLGPTDFTRETRQRVDTLAQEVSTGRTRDAGQALRSDFSEFSRLSADLHRLDADAMSLRQAGRWGASMQAVLERLGQTTSILRGGLEGGFGVSETFISDQASDAFREMAAALNQTLGERSLFARGGQNAPIPDVDAVLSDISALAVTSTGFDDYAAQVDAYFQPGGQFETTRLAAMPDGAVDFPAGEGQIVTIDVSATSPEVLDTLAQVALVAGLADGGFDVRPNSTASLEIAARFARSAGGLPQLQGRLGSVEARIEARLEQTDRARHETEMAIADQVGIDPYETASKLQNEISRLETLYAITARRSQLRLTDYL